MPAEKTNEFARRAFTKASGEMSIKPAAPVIEYGAIDALLAAFEGAARRDEDGVEYWTARDLQRLLDYSDYRNLLKAVDKAKEACAKSGHAIADHFVDATDMIELGKGVRSARRSRTSGAENLPAAEDISKVERRLKKAVGGSPDRLK